MYLLMAKAYFSRRQPCLGESHTMALDGRLGANCHGINTKFMCSSAFVPICTSKCSICIYRHSRPQQTDGQYCSILCILESHPDDLIQPFSSRESIVLQCISLTFYGEGPTTKHGKRRNRLHGWGNNWVSGVVVVG